MDWSSSKGDCPVLEQQQQQQPFPANHTDEFSVDMKLGSVIAASQTRNSPVSLPSKRARAVSNNSQQSAYCLVDDCTSDLSNCREYHRRHKVCEVHSKTTEVTIQGNKQRFCQQCSRFHALDEFDEGKRSCRKRLDGHNRRRRKPQPETHLEQGTYLPNFPGAGLLSFCNPSSSPTHALTWSGSVNESKDPYNRKPHLNLLDKQNPFTDNSSPHYKEAKQLTIFQGENQMNHSATAQSSKHKVFYDGLTTQAPDSDCALSLLSRPMLPMHTTTTTEINFRNAIQMQTHQALPSSDQRSSHFSTLQPIVPATDIDFHNMFHTGPDSPNGNINDQPQTLPFYWE